MKKVILPAIVALAVSTSGALGADLGKMVTKAPPPPPSPWDLAFGAALQSDYIFRGITQTAHKPGVTAYFEPRYNVSKTFQIYAGVAGSSIDFPNRAAAEIDFYGGFRPTFGSLALDVGAIYYYYPGGQCFNTIGNPGAGTDCVGPIPVNGNVAKAKADFFEVYAKATYTFNDNWAVGANFYYTPNYVNTGADGQYLSGTVKYTGNALPNGAGWYASGEFGRQWLGAGDIFYAFPIGLTSVPYQDYNTWNVGLGFTYKVFTLDLRYYDTDISKGNCNALTSDHTARANGFITPINPAPGFGSSWCSATFVAKLGFDLTLDSLK